MSSRTAPALSPKLQLPARWALGLCAGFFWIAPFRFLGFAAGTVAHRLVKMASLLIPIKLLFLVRNDGNGFDMPVIGGPIDIGQLELTMLVLPIGALVVAAHLTNQLLTKRKEALAAELRARAEADGLEAKKAQALVTNFSKAVSDGILALTCIGLMALIMPQAAGVVALFMLGAAFATRWRVKRMHRQAGACESEDEWNTAAIVRQTGVISDGTQAVTQALLLPILIYLVAGEILSGQLEPIFAVAALMLFRLLVGGTQGAFGAGARFLQTLHDEPKWRGWLMRNMP